MVEYPTEPRGQGPKGLSSFFLSPSPLLLSFNFSDNVLSMYISFFLLLFLSLAFAYGQEGCPSSDFITSSSSST